MSISRWRNLVLISIALLLSGSCAVSYKPYKADHPAPVNWDRSALWFHGADCYAVYNTAIDMKKRHFTGLMVIDSTDKGGHRVVFVTEFGLKIFDMEFSDTGDFMLHYCMSAINKKMIINMLRDDIGMILGDAIPDKPYSVLHDAASGNYVIRTRNGSKRYYCSLDPETQKVRTLIRTSLLSRKVRADFTGNEGSVPDSILLSHYHLNLTIKLNQIHAIQ